MTAEYRPTYLSLYESGELAGRVEALGFRASNNDSLFALPLSILFIQLRPIIFGRASLPLDVVVIEFFKRNLNLGP